MKIKFPLGVGNQSNAKFSISDANYQTVCREIPDRETAELIDNAVTSHKAAWDAMEDAFLALGKLGGSSVDSPVHDAYEKCRHVMLHYVRTF